MFRCNLSSGPTSSEISSGADLKAVDLLNRFFKNEVWDLLVTETNRYAAPTSALLHALVHGSQSRKKR